MNKEGLPRIAILISGNGTNMEKIIESCENGVLDAEVALVISDKPNAPGVAKARARHVRTIVRTYATDRSREQNEAPIVETIARERIDWIVLAGFMRVLSGDFVRRFRGRIVNIHPSLLPAFPGAHAIEDALEAKADFTGVTVHIVDELVDHGPVMAQEEVPIYPGDSLETLSERIHTVEHRLYPRTLQQLLHENI